MNDLLVKIALKILGVHPYEWERLTSILTLMRTCKKQSESMKDGVITFEFDMDLR